jgi:hypothetical protein
MPAVAHHKPGHTPQGLNKMPAPAAVSCTAAAGGVTVDWGTVDGAGGYQLEYMCLGAAGLPVEESEFVGAEEAPPSSKVPVECSLVLSVRVRTTVNDGPSGGPKGAWSEQVSCIIAPQ